MSDNQHRSTAGKTLVAFALLAAVVAAFALYLYINREKDEFTSYPTGLGDTELYTEDLGPGFDLFQPNLVFEEMPEEFGVGLYRRNHGSVHVEDGKAKRLTREKEDRYWVYTTPSKTGKSIRYLLKSGEDAYIEFGKQKYFPEPGDTRPGALPRNPAASNPGTTP